MQIHDCIFAITLIVRRVLNAWGPQTVDQTLFCKGRVNDANLDTTSCFSVLDERISVAERTVGINRPVPKDVYERLKNLEDRILHLESISPEYKDFWVYLSFVYLDS